MSYLKMLQVEKIDTFGGHHDAIYELTPVLEKYNNKDSFSTSKFYSAGADGLVVRWNLDKPDLGELIAKVPNSIYAMCMDMTKNELWIGQNFEGVHVIDPISKTELRSLKLSNSAIFDIQIFDNQAFIASGDGLISVVDTEGFVFKKHIKASNKSVRCLAINPVERDFVAGFSDNTIGVFDLKTFELKSVIEAHQNSVFTLKYSPDFRFLLSAGRDAHLKVWNVLEKYSLEKDIVAHLYAINHIAYSPDNQLFATCSMDKSIKIWDAESFKLLKVIDRARHAGHGTSINKLLWLKNEINSDSYRLISCSDDRTISVWNIIQ